MKSLSSFLAIVLTALALTPFGAHALELSPKLTLDLQDYFLVQSIYSGWAALGWLIVAAIAANVWATILRRADGAGAWLNGAAAVVLLATLAVFFAWTGPANLATHNWTSQPADWRSVRAQWEYSHLANASLTFVALCCAIAAAHVRGRHGG
jgi:hypothetical protein